MSGLIAAVGNLGDTLSRFTQRWIPDSWVVCMILTVVACLLAIFGAGATLGETVLAWGGGMWALLELAMQFTIAMIAARTRASPRGRRTAFSTGWPRGPTRRNRFTRWCYWAPTRW